MIYVIAEMQTFDNGKVAVLNTTFDDENEAKAKYHAVLSAAAVSKLPLHACAMMTNYGEVLRNECFEHEIKQQEETENAGND